MSSERASTALALCRLRVGNSATRQGEDTAMDLYFIRARRLEDGRGARGGREAVDRGRRRRLPERHRLDPQLRHQGAERRARGRPASTRPPARRPSASTPTRWACPPTRCCRSPTPCSFAPTRSPPPPSRDRHRRGHRIPAMATTEPRPTPPPTRSSTSLPRSRATTSSRPTGPASRRSAARGPSGPTERLRGGRGRRAARRDRAGAAGEREPARSSAPTTASATASTRSSSIPPGTS